MRVTRVGAAIAGAAALALGGCGIDKADEHGRQLDVIGNVELSTTFCTSGDVDGGSRACAPFSFGHRGQVLVAYRLPDRSAIPAELTDDGGVRHFTWSASYTAYMRDTYPEDGMYWAAYVSDPYSSGAGEQYAFTLSPEVTLPDVVAPFAGPLPYQVVGGYRSLSPGEDAGSPVDCTDTASTACDSTGVAAHDALQPTRDVAVLPGGDPPAVEAGSHVAVPFDLRFAGSGGEGVVFSLSSPDGTVSQTTLAPDASSDNAVTVDVPVAAGTEPGDYEVTLTATATGTDDTVIRKGRAARFHVGGVQTRSGSMGYRVVAPSPHPPAVDPPATVEPPAAAPPPAAPAHTEPPPPVPVPVPVPVESPRAARARLALTLTALPRRALSGTDVRYRVVARNVSRVPALRTRVCVRLPRVVQLVRGVRCFARARLASGARMTAVLVAHIDIDFEGGTTLARATAHATNAARVHARARMRIREMPRHAVRSPAWWR
jgi:hypothetical protein